VGFGIGTGDQRLDSQPLGALRARGGGARRSAGISRYGVMALSWTQDRLGRICRYGKLRHRDAGDCEARWPDMSVSDIPSAGMRQLRREEAARPAIIRASFDELTNATVKANAENSARTLRAVGSLESSITSRTTSRVHDEHERDQRPNRSSSSNSSARAGG